MKNYLELAKKIQSDPEENQLSLLEEHNLKEIFTPIYKLNQPILTLNSVVAYIILAYTNGSPWLDLNKDRLQNKIGIVQGLKIPIDNFIQEIIDGENSVVNSVISAHLEDQASWEFQQAASYLDSHQRLVKFANEKVEIGFKTEVLNKDGNKVDLFTEYSSDNITANHEKKAKLLAVAHDNRVKASELSAKLKGDYVQLEHAVQQDFGFSITEEKRIDPASWRHFMKYDYLPRKKTV